MDTYKVRRLQAIKNLGSECVCCGERCQWVLQFDHKNGDGASHRKSVSKPNSFFIMTQLSAGRDLDRFQLLCANCHTIKTKLSRLFRRNPTNDKINQVRQEYNLKSILLRPFYPKAPANTEVFHSDGTPATVDNPIDITIKKVNNNDTEK